MLRNNIGEKTMIKEGEYKKGTRKEEENKNGERRQSGIYSLQHTSTSLLVFPIHAFADILVTNNVHSSHFGH